MFEESVRNFRDAVRLAIFQGPNPYEQIPLHDFSPTDMGLIDAIGYFQKNNPHDPHWLDFFQQFLEIESTPPVVNLNNSLIFLMTKNLGEYGTRMFAFTAGLGFHGLNRSRLEKGFGFHVALNTIAVNGVKAADTQTLDTNTRMKRVVMGQYTSIENLDLNEEEDILNYLAGRPRRLDFAKNVSGRDSLNLNKDDVRPTKFGELIEELFWRFRSTSYIDKFPGVNTLPIVTDEALEEDLNHELHDSLLAGDGKQAVHFTHPNINTWENTSYYVFHAPDGGEMSTTELEYERIRTFVEKHARELDEFLNILVTGFDDDNNTTISERRLLDYCTFGTSGTDSTFHLLHSTWYIVSKQYLNRIDAFISNIELADYINLPEWSKEKVFDKKTEEEKYSYLEGTYNEKATELLNQASGGELFLTLDKKNVTIPGRTAIEPCDILSKDGLFIHVKKKSGSANLGHLWNQGLVSGDLFANSRDFRQGLLDVIEKKLGKKSWITSFTVDQAAPRNYKIVYAVGLKDFNNWKKDLPLFAKLALVNCTKRLRAQGYTVQITHVDMV